MADKGSSSKQSAGPAGEPLLRGDALRERTADSASMRAQNRSLVLKLIWCEAMISRAEIARRTGLSRSTVSDIVAELKRTGLVREAGLGESMGGKRPRMLAINKSRFGLIGIDMGATHIGVALTDVCGQLVRWLQVDHPVRENPLGTLQEVKRLLTELIRSRPEQMAQLVGVGLAVPCPVDPEHPNQLSARVLPAWEGIKLHDELCQFIEAPVLVDNDANLGALAEMWWGEGTGHQALAYIKLGTGVGCGFVFDGKIFHGSKSLAGELGHMALNPAGPVCICGRRGCLVNYVGAQQIVDRAATLYAERQGAHQDKPPRPNLNELISALETSCPIAHEVINEAGLNLARAVANIVNLVNPDVVIVGGSVARAGDTLMQPVAALLREQSNWTSAANTELAISKLGASGIALGAATYVLQDALNLFAYFEHARTL